MGRDLADNFVAARAVFEEVDDALGEKLSDLIWNGPEEDLTLTANAQPALMAVSMAVIRALEAEGFALQDRVSFVAGHSLGEYSALAAAGTFSVSDTARLLRTRGEAMQQAVPVGIGAMAVIIGLEGDDVESICRNNTGGGGSCQIANDNGASQLVISGDLANVEEAARQADAMGAKRARLLPVSAPFHSALMAPAADVMKEALARVEMTAPAVPLVANVLAGPVTDPGRIAELLVAQVTGQVRWRETVDWLAANGVDAFCELGAGKVLTGLARRIAPDAAAIAVNTPQDIADLLAR